MYYQLKSEDLPKDQNKIENESIMHNESNLVHV